MSYSTNQVAPTQPVVNTQPGQPGVYTQPYGGQPGQQYVGQPGQQFAGQPGQNVMLGGMGNAVQPPPQVWMPKPPSGPPGCPPGLDYLTQVDQILIKQQIEMMELFTNWEAKNKYRLLNSMGQQVYFAKEESETCMRQCCRENRSFTMHVTDNLGNEVIRLEREFRCWRDSNWCACCSCCAHRIVVEAPVGTVVGYVKQRPSFMAPKYVIMDENEKDILYIEGPCCVCQGCPCDVNFTIHSATDGETEVGKIQKQWGNLLQEMFTSADNFGVTFPMDLDVKMKAVMIGATFLIDFMYFEGAQNRHHY
ncbi:phospholipid scramblase 2-like isoform X2 [Mercenaria mercenaria]|uniref:phospholipid scramblase 2-like isoform X2 n=1 Tax=Mercenaria mercenaria TaxID=6596 RepID=UPI00234F059E|nr:phospholipid scramblase 2-like isoform X2 [Mercenaria mercenaria]